MENKKNKIKFTPPPINHMEVFEACAALIKTKDKTRTDKKACLTFLENTFCNVEPNIHLDFDDGDGPNWTPLMVACYYNFKEGVKLLLELGADPNTVMLKDNKTALEMISVNSNIEIYNMLVEAGGDPNYTNNHGKCVLLSALEKKGTKAKDFLIHILNENNLDLNITSPDGLSPLDYAYSHDNETAGMILNHDSIKRIMEQASPENDTSILDDIMDFKI